MKKERREPKELQMRPEYDFKLGERGKYVARFKEGTPASWDSTGRVRAWAPLIDLSWSGTDRQIVSDTWIRGQDAYAGHRTDEAIFYLSKEERERCEEARHWLCIDQSIHSGLSSAAAVNLFLSALWIVVPTRVQAPFRFEETESEQRVTRILDRVQWIEGQVVEDVEDRNLDEVAKLSSPLRDLYMTTRRLRNALVLTHQGLLARQWQIAFVCFAAAAESLLACSRNTGLTRSLAENFARVTATDQVDRREARERFARLYVTRSDVIHGRGYGRSGSEVNLKDLAEFSDVLRQLWRAILKSPEARRALEESDADRKQFFDAMA